VHHTPPMSQMAQQDQKVHKDLGMTATPSAPAAIRRHHERRSSRATASVLALLLAGVAAAAPTTSRAQVMPIDEETLPLSQTHPMGFVVMGAFATCSVVSTIGNAVTYAQKKPHRGWMTSGFVCGFLNFISGPIVLAYGRDASPAFGFGTGAGHVVLGATNLGLSIANAVLWHKQRIAADALPPVALLPYVGRDSAGGDVIGLSASGAF
jgi:hypothetical protein